MPKPRGRGAWLVVLLAAGLGLLLFREALLGGRVFFWHDVSLAYMPLKQIAQEAVRAGHLPLWAPQLGSGFPVLAEGQASTFYPATLLDYAGVPFYRAYGWIVYLQLVLAAVGAALLARRLKLGWAGAAFAGLAFGFSGYFLSKVLFLTVLQSGAWLPWLLWCLLAGLESGRWPWFVGGAGALALAVLGGHPQIVFYEVVAALALLAWWLLAGREAPRRVRLGRAVGGGLVALGLGVGLAAVQLVPTLGLARFAESRATPTAEYLREMSLRPQNLAYLVHPYVFGSYAHNDYWGGDHYYEVCGYVGGITLLLAWVALFCPAVRLRYKGFWIALGLLGLFLALAEHNPVYELLPRVPGFNLFRAPGRWLLLTSLSLPLLAGAVVHAVGGPQRRAVGRSLAGWSLAGLLACGALVGGLYLAKPQAVRALERLLPAPALAEAGAGSAAQKAERKWTDLARALSLGDPQWAGFLAGLAIAGLLGLPLAWGVFPPRAAQGLLLWVLLVQLYGFGREANGTAPASYYTEPPATAALMLKDGRWGREYTDFDLEKREALPPGYGGWAGGDLGPYLAAREPLRANLAPLYGLEAAHAEYGLVPKRQKQLWEQALPAGLAGRPGGAAAPVEVLRLAGVRWLVAAPGLDLGGLRAVLRGSGFWLYEIAEPLPEAWLPQRVEACLRPEVALNKLEAGDLRPRVRAYVEGLSPAQAAALDGGGAEVTVAEGGATRLVCQLHCPREAFLMLNMSYHPQWEATVNGAPAKLLRANYVQCGVPVPAGDSTVELRFVARDLARGLRVTLVTGALAVLLLLLTGRRRRDERGGEGETDG